MELIFNIWFIVDIGTDLSKYAITKAYVMNGTDERKTELLKILAESDYLTSERFDYTSNGSVVFKNLTAEGYIHSSVINNYFDINIDYFLSKMENKLPLLVDFNSDFFGDFKAEKQKFRDNPLFVLTILMENEYGYLRPYTSQENKAWYEKEKNRIEIKSRGIQN